MSNTAEDKRKILCVGLICVDLVVTANEYPEEDTLISGLRHRWQRGGNAGNDCTVLSHLNCPCECLATFVKNGKNPQDNYYTEFLINDFKRCDIGISNCVFHDNCYCPYSFITTNDSNGTRTIVHQNRDLPELHLEDFQKLPLQEYKWIHFEGRHPETYSKMMETIVNWNKNKPREEQITISVEMEFLDVNHDELIPYADYISVNKEIAKVNGYNTKEKAISKIWLPIKEGAGIIIPWGDQGAVARIGDQIVASDAFKPKKVVDTLGAGDTFLSSTIFALSKGHDLKSSITFGCKVSGMKCGQEGFDGLRHTALKIYHELFPQEKH